ncbi:hypothetical protein RPMA_11945 [Tardiphaga alba]|uniref:Uncharacterized protein n=1 Tax=Tardiphaga alba TaxID=340268 RepID=A0ABX8A7P1_9BRAD|nr:hypothetical protein [Tardiphaga alba]QUS39467.1 hypothetical protein RPMA_11945 [Tardiphaga alba]
MSITRLFKDIDGREILLEQAKLLRERASKMPHGVERERLIKAARLSEAQANGGRWAESTELRPPG